MKFARRQVGNARVALVVLLAAALALGLGFVARAWLSGTPGGASAPGASATVLRPTQLATEPGSQAAVPALAASLDGGGGGAGQPATWSEAPGPGLQAERSAVPVVGQVAPEEVGRALLAWSGHVLDRQDRAPIEAADVLLKSGSYTQRARTDEFGLFQLHWPAGLAGELHLDHPAYVQAKVLQPNLEQDGEFLLQASGSLFGQLSRPPAAAAQQADAVPVGRALLWLQNSPNPRDWPMQHAPIDAAGAFQFLDLVPGDYALHAELPDELVPFESGVQIASGEQRRIVLDLSLRSCLRGRVLERPRLAPLAGVHLRAWPDRQGVPAAVKTAGTVESDTDAQGEFTLDGLFPGPYRIELSSPWGGLSAQGFEVAGSGREFTRDFQVAGPARLSGWVVDASGHGLGQAQLHCFPARNHGAVESLYRDQSPVGTWSVETEADGSFQLEDLPAGERLLLFASAGAGPDRLRGQLELSPLGTAEQRQDLKVTASPELALRGAVRGSEGEPLPGAELELHYLLGHTQAAFGHATADQEGHFVLAPLLEGRARLELHCSGFLSQAIDELELFEACSSDLVLRMERACSIEGRVIDTQGYAVPNLALRLRVDPQCPEARSLEKSQSRFLMRSDGLGGFAFGGLRPATWLVEPASADYELIESQPRRLLLDSSPAGGRAFVELTVAARRTLERAGLRGFVRRSDDAPLFGLRVEGFKGGAVEIDAGEFRVSGLEPGSTSVRLRADGCVTSNLGPFELLPGKTYDLGAVLLDPATRLTVKVLDTEGKPPPKVRASLRWVSVAAGGLGESQRPIDLEPAGQGRLRGERVPRKHFRLRVEAEGFQTYQKEIEVGPQAEQDLEVTLERQG